MIRIISVPAMTTEEHPVPVDPVGCKPGCLNVEDGTTIRFIQGCQTGDIAKALEQQSHLNCPTEVYDGVTRTYYRPAGTSVTKGVPVVVPAAMRIPRGASYPRELAETVGFLTTDEGKQETSDRGPYHHVIPLYDILKGSEDTGEVQSRLDYVANVAGGAHTISYFASAIEFDEIAKGLILPCDPGVRGPIMAQGDRNDLLTTTVMGNTSGKYCADLFTWDGGPSSRWIVEHLLGRGPCVQTAQSVSHKFSFRGHRVEHVAFLEGTRALNDGLHIMAHTNYVIVTGPVGLPSQAPPLHEIMVLLTECTHVRKVEALGHGQPIIPIIQATACDIARVLGCFKDGAEDKTCAEAASLWVYAMCTTCPTDADSRSRFATGVIQTIAHTVLKPLIEQHILTVSSSVEETYMHRAIPVLQRYQSEYPHH